MSNIHFYTEQNAGKSFELNKGDVIIISLEDNLALGQTWVNAHQPTQGIKYVQSSQAVLPLLPKMPDLSLEVQVGLKIFVYQFEHEGTVTLHQVTAGQTTKTITYTFRGETPPPPPKKPISVLVMADVANYLSEKDEKYIYLFDTSKSKHGRHTTQCSPEDSLLWRVQTVSPSDLVEVTGIAGSAVNQGIITPPKQHENLWQATVKTATSGTYTYQLHLLLNHQTVVVDLLLEVNGDMKSTQLQTNGHSISI
ncbi:hypothetical protein [uncultured Microscilla sp.]|uniref:hypothetical protein n=1 Tax=uncultured Microscilla sp. TaxID=432653 RepID=UPI0026066015|nr:hypothetical protein [uncultured Microscilla sp.]